MKKLALIAMVMVMLLMTACGKEETPSADVPTPKETVQVTETETPNVMEDTDTTDPIPEETIDPDSPLADFVGVDPNQAEQQGSDPGGETPDYSELTPAMQMRQAHNDKIANLKDNYWNNYHSRDTKTEYVMTYRDFSDEMVITPKTYYVGEVTPVWYDYDAFVPSGVYYVSDEISLKSHRYIAEFIVLGEAESYKTTVNDYDQLIVEIPVEGNYFYNEEGERFYRDPSTITCVWAPEYNTIRCRWTEDTGMSNEWLGEIDITLTFVSQDSSNETLWSYCKDFEYASPEEWES